MGSERTSQTFHAKNAETLEFGVTSSVRKFRRVCVCFNQFDTSLPRGALELPCPHQQSYHRSYNAYKERSKMQVSEGKVERCKPSSKQLPE